MQVKQLADQVGGPLFEQVGRRTHLTELGQELLVAAEEITAALDRFESALAARRGLRKGRLRLAVVSTAEYFVPRLLGEFRRAFPAIEVTLKVMNRERVLESLRQNLDDLCVMARPPEDMDIVRTEFGENPLVVIGRAGHPLTGRRRIPLNALASEEFILREPGSGTRLVTESFSAAHGMRLRAGIELGSNEAIKQAVAGGLGLAVLSTHTLNAQSTLDGLQVLDVEGFPIPAHWYVVHPQGKQLSVVARTFLDYLARAAPELTARARGRG
jgi:DNA-binding transcriptional LysR family regulator